MIQEIEQISEVAGYLWQKGWAERNGGNITVNVTCQIDEALKARKALSEPIAIGQKMPYLKDQYFYAKGTGKRMRDLWHDPMANGSIIRICDDCEHYEIVADQLVMPTSELPSHLEVQNYLMRHNSDYRATMHTHPIELVAMSHISKFLDSDYLTHLLWSMIPETLAFAPLGIGVVPYRLPGSRSLADATLNNILHHGVVLWEKHGVFAVGKTIMDAFDEVDVLNKAAQIYQSARSMGFEPEGLTDQAIREIQAVFHLPTER